MKKQFTYEDCYKAAKQCKTRQEFKKKYPREYNASYNFRNDDNTRWISNFEWLEFGCKRYTYEDCYKAAKKCELKKDFAQKYPKEYNASYNNKNSDGVRWLDTFDWLKTLNKYTYEDCYKAAKQCKTRQEFIERFPLERTISYKHKNSDGIRWLDTFDWLEVRHYFTTTTIINSFIENIDFWDALTIPEILGIASAFGSQSLMNKMLKKLAKSGPESEERKFMLDSIKEMEEMSEDEALEEINKDEDDEVKENDMIEEIVKAAENMPSDEVEYTNELERIGKVMVGMERLQSNKDIMNIINSGNVIKTLKDSITKRILLLSFEHPQVFDELEQKYCK